MSDTQQTPAGLITVGQAAALLMKSRERIRQLAAEGYIPKVGRDQYPLVGVVQGYIRFRDDAARRTEPARAKEDLDRARTKLIELRIKQAAARLVPTAEVEAYVQMIVEEMLSQMEALPSDLLPDPQSQERLSKALAGLRVDMAQLMAKHAPSRKGTWDVPEDL